MNEQWEQKRSTTFLVFTFQYFLCAVELSISYSTSWLYIKEIVADRDQLNVYYGLLYAVTYIPSLLFINVIAHYGNKYRRIKILIIAANTFSLAGSVIYVIPGSPLYLLLRHLFLGFNLAIRPLMFGEIARSYRTDELKRNIQIIRGIFVFGKAAGPLGVVCFFETDFWIGTFHIRYANISSLIVFIITLFTQVVLTCFAHDLSKEYDLKEGLLKSSLMEVGVDKKLIEEDFFSKVFDKDKTCQNDTNHQINQKYTNLSNKNNKAVETSFCLNYQTLSSFELIKKSLKDSDIVFIMMANFVSEFISQILILAIPVVIIKNLSYSRSTVNMVFVIQVVSFCILFLILYYIRMKQISSALLGWFIGIICVSGMTIVSRSFSYTINVSLLTISLTLAEICGLNLRVFFSVSLANLVQSKYQSFVDSIRVLIYLLSYVIGSFIAPLAAQCLIEVGSTLIVGLWICLMVTLVKREAYRNIKVKI